MSPHTLSLALLLSVAAPLACSDSGSTSDALQAPFEALDYEAALEKAEAEDRLLMLDFTASWCPPCREMEETTWPDADVQAWVAREAVAIQVDVDEQGELARTYRAASIPTIVFVDPSGEELGRFVGYRDPAGFLTEARKHVD